MYADLYDFDKTVFNGESGTEFFLFCLKKQPHIAKFLPRQIFWAFRYYVLHNVTMEKFKENLYCCVKELDAKKMIELFWQENGNRINDWFINRDKSVPCIVCSASPYWQISPICEKLGVDIIIGTDLNPETAVITGKNCKGDEKLKFIEKYAPDYEIRDAYTDNIDGDAPLLSLATRNRYKVTKGKITKI